MPIEVRPLGVKCNISCHYCYQSNLREAGVGSSEYDLDKIRDTLIEKNLPFTIFGGEPLLIPKKDLDKLFSLGFERFGSNAIQTNGALIDDDHIGLFKKYRVSVGISVDGPGECNRARWAGSDKRTAQITERTAAAIERLLQAGISPGIITTLHRDNASSEMLPQLLDWFIGLDRMGVTSARIHVLEVDSAPVGRDLALSTEENIKALLALDSLERDSLVKLKFDLFTEIEALLNLADNKVSCIWRACDPYTTPAVQGVEGHGQSSNCGRTNKIGVDFAKASNRGFERYIALYYTPFAFGGCNGCRFFLICKGQCPGTGIDGDWRNRSDQCETWLGVFEHVERRMLANNATPLSLSPQRALMETIQLQAWASGSNPTLAQIAKTTRESTI